MGGGSHLRDTEADSGMWRGAQIRVVETGGWCVQATSRWTELRSGRGGGDRVQERGDVATNTTDRGAAVG